MNHAEKCPVCGGSGQVDKVQPDDVVMHRWETCHGCGGAGWVTVPDDIPHVHIPSIWGEPGKISYETKIHPKPDFQIPNKNIPDYKVPETTSGDCDIRYLSPYEYNEDSTDSPPAWNPNIHFVGDAIL